MQLAERCGSISKVRSIFEFQFTNEYKEIDRASSEIRSHDFQFTRPLLHPRASEACTIFDNSTLIGKDLLTHDWLQSQMFQTMCKKFNLL
jgi:hypothetical protein